MSKTAPAEPQFNDDEKRLIQSHAYQVWEECAYDILASVAEEKGKSIDTVSVSRGVAMEIALDAGRMEERLRNTRRRGHDTLTDDFFERLDQASYEQLIVIAKPAFRSARYCL